MTIILVTLVAGGLLYWFPVRRWYRRSDARRLNAGRAMSGDVAILVPDVRETLAMTMEAPPAEVWKALLKFGWPQTGRSTYEWLGRVFGYLDPRSTGNRSKGAERVASEGIMPVGRRSEIPVRSIDPSRALVLGRAGAHFEWVWQFELAALDERRTRLILRTGARVTDSAGGRLFLPVRRAVSFVLTRKMLLDIKRSAEGKAADTDPVRSSAA